LQAEDDYCVTTFWLALNDASIDNACLHVVPGSHKYVLNRELLLDSDFQNNVYADSIPLEISKGMAVIFNEKTLHGPGLQESQSSKTAMAIRYMTAGACDLNMDKTVVVTSGDIELVTHDSCIEKCELAKKLATGYG
jgi:ectoine hydroxylase-related dioxygenase (phytanoyl-CoA dioxygenase family)